ncbi:endolytic transglycosylase MltG [Candidatus Saccharibacteria bacterium]|nr:MAG: endolytic transglycosylase MltG [Candidatus Saccharibacteria bacterium]
MKTCQENQRRIAQVFYRRLELGMTLGSDVTFIYGADKLGIPPSVDVDSPYNTRIHAGLPPDRSRHRDWAH